jgi:hypothetical protein
MITLTSPLGQTTWLTFLPLDRLPSPIACATSWRGRLNILISMKRSDCFTESRMALVKGIFPLLHVLIMSIIGILEVAIWVGRPSIIKCVTELGGQECVVISRLGYNTVRNAKYTRAIFFSDMKRLT